MEMVIRIPPVSNKKSLVDGLGRLLDKTTTNTKRRLGSTYFSPTACQWQEFCCQEAAKVHQRSCMSDGRDGSFHDGSPQIKTSCQSSLSENVPGPAPTLAPLMTAEEVQASDHHKEAQSRPCHVGNTGRLQAHCHAGVVRRAKRCWLHADYLGSTKAVKAGDQKGTPTQSHLCGC